MTNSKQTIKEKKTNINKKMFFVVIRDNDLEGMFWNSEDAHKIANELKEKDLNFWHPKETIVYRTWLSRIK